MTDRHTRDPRSAGPAGAAEGKFDAVEPSFAVQLALAQIMIEAVRRVEPVGQVSI